MYETPFFVVVAKEGTTYHDFESKLTVNSHPVEVTNLTAGILNRLQQGGLKVVDATGRVSKAGRPGTRVETILGGGKSGEVPATATAPVKPAKTTTRAVPATPAATVAEQSLDDLLGDTGDDEGGSTVS